VTTWAHDSIFYHIYPLGLCGAPHENDFTAAPEPRLNELHAWLPHIEGLQSTALYLGPLFESRTHGYDTADYFRVDRRLGTHQTLADLVAACHERGIRVVLDGVFHHVGRDFWAFREVQQHGASSPYREWFVGLDFAQPNAYGDPFTYAGWREHTSLVKLNLQHPDVRDHLFDAVRSWIEQFAIDGLRLDVAEDIETAFLRDLAALCRSVKPDFWLLGEAIHGDYRRLAGPDLLDSVTNYECYKGLYSSHNDQNYFEIAYALNRQSGEQGIYRNIPLYNFVDNHDVSRIASTLQNPAHLYPLHVLLLTMPGIPSIYYGSEWGIGGIKRPPDDWELRPTFPAPQAVQSVPHPDLAATIARVAQIRQQTPALRRGMYQQIFVAHEQMAFARSWEDEYVVVVVNAAAESASLTLDVSLPDGSILVDRLAADQEYMVRSGRLHLDDIPPHWARILTRSS
jgi:glycosidase